MTYAIIGFGRLGQALAKAFARSGIDVAVATTRAPESYAADAAAIGPTIIPMTLAQAIKADIIFLAVRYPLGVYRRLSHFEVEKPSSTVMTIRPR